MSDTKKQVEVMGYPDGFVELATEAYGAEEVARLCRVIAEHQAPVSVRLHPYRAGDLSGLDVVGEVPWCPWGRYLSKRPEFIFDPSFHAGAYYVQEASSMALYEVVKQCVTLTPDSRVLDLCASPGGKTTLVASMLPKGAVLLANEVIKTRVGALQENVTRWGLGNTLVSSCDSSFLAKGLGAYFDLVVCDVPCSGEGLWRKNKEAINEWSEDAVQLCQARQRRIVENAVACLAYDGVLIYSTCTYNKKENDDNIAWLLENFNLEQIDLQFILNGVIKTEYGYGFLPSNITGEGFFIAALKSKNSDVEVVKQTPNKLLSKSKPNLAEDFRAFGNLKETHFWGLEEASQGVFVLPEFWMDKHRILLNFIRQSAFFTLGILKGKSVIPTQELAYFLDFEFNKDLIINLDKNEALIFLRGEVPEGLLGLLGWRLVCFQGLPLGWAKCLGNRANNYLEQKFRILKRN